MEARNDISESDEEYYAKRKLNWDTDIILEREDYPDLDYLEIGRLLSQ